MRSYCVMHFSSQTLSCRDEVYHRISFFGRCYQGCVKHLFICDGSITQVSGEEADYFCLVDFSQFENGNVPQEYHKSIEKICEDTVIEYFQECLDREEGSEDEIDRIKENNPGPWSRNLFTQFLSAYEDEKAN